MFFERLDDTYAGRSSSDNFSILEVGGVVPPEFGSSLAAALFLLAFIY